MVFNKSFLKLSSYDVKENHKKHDKPDNNSIILTSFTQPVRQYSSQIDDLNTSEISPVTEERLSFDQISLSSEPTEIIKEKNKKKWSLIVLIIVGIVIFLAILLIVIWILYVSNVFSYYY